MQRNSTSRKRLISSRQNGSYGGQARAILYDKDVLSEWASWGGKAVLKKYGRDYFIEIRKRRRKYPKYNG
jgi:hypothetical protein